MRFRTLFRPSINFSPGADCSANTIFNLTIFKPLAMCYGTKRDIMNKNRPVTTSKIVCSLLPFFSNLNIVYYFSKRLSQKYYFKIKILYTKRISVFLFALKQRRSFLRMSENYNSSTNNTERTTNNSLLLSVYHTPLLIINSSSFVDQTFYQDLLSRPFIKTFIKTFY